MHCEEILVLLSGYLDNMNTSEEEALLQAHLDTCAACRERLYQWQAAEQQIKAEPVPDGLKDHIMAQIKREAAKKKTRPWAPLAVAAALMLVIGIGAFSDLRPSVEQPSVEQPMETAVAQARVMTAMPEEALAQRLAQELSAPVALVREVYEELTGCESKAVDGGILYTLPDENTAYELFDRYACPVYYPEEAAGDISYALVVD